MNGFHTNEAELTQHCAGISPLAETYPPVAFPLLAVHVTKFDVVEQETPVPEQRELRMDQTSVYRVL